jgi:DNA-directed RNA polymerase
MDNILKMEKEFIMKAENRFVFSAFCLTMRELNKNPNFKVKLPVFLDCTCSGIQHLAAIMRDLQLATQVNLIPQDDTSKMGDIYNSLKEPINELIRQEGRDNELFPNLKYVDLQRSDIKTPIMTKTYNVTVLGIKEQLISKFNKIKEGNEELFLVPSINKDKIVKLNNIELLKIA